MTSKPISPNQDAELDLQKEYAALVRSIRWTEGFGLLFVQCSPVEGERLIPRVREDVPEKSIEVLKLTESIDNLYDIVDALPNRDQINTLFIQGIEYSLYEYEKTQLWDEPEERYNYSEKGLPRLLGHLNLARERFRDHFKIFFVFLVPKFALKYLIRRAPDFFDWRSGVLEFVSDGDLVNKEFLRLLRGVSYEKYLSWTQSERNRRILEIQAWSDELNQPSKGKAALLIVQGILLAVSQDYESAIASYDRSLKLEPNDSQAWIERGNAWLQLERYEEAISSYDKALALEPDSYGILVKRCIVLLYLNRFEELNLSYRCMSQLAPHDRDSWYLQGLMLKVWGSSRLWGQTGIERLTQEGLIELDPLDEGSPVNLDDLDNVFAGYIADRQRAKARVISKLDEAINCFNQVLKIQPDDSDAYYKKAACYALQPQTEDAIVNLQSAIALNPEYRQKAAADSDFDSIRHDDRFQALIHETKP